MAFFAKGKKCDLSLLAAELGIALEPDVTIVKIKDLIIEDASYDEEFTKTLLETIISTRKEAEASELARKEKEIEVERLRLENETKTRQLVLETEAKKQQMEFELEKLRIEAGLSAPKLEKSIPNNVQIELSKSMPRFDSKDCDILLYLSLFERQVKRMKIGKEDMVSYLLPLMPSDILELIARIPEEEFGNYEYVKDVLLKKFKMNAEGFRQKFVQHQRRPEKTWRDFVYELTNYFQGWVEGLEITDFEGLKNLIIADQVKKRAPIEVRDHFVDEWGKIVNPSILADKLDEYESVRKSFKRQTSSPPKAPFQTYNKYPAQRDERRPENQGTPRTENRQSNFKSQQEVPKTRPKYVCFACGMDGHVKKFCPKFTKTRNEQDAKKKFNVNRVSVERCDEEKETKISETAVVAKVMSHNQNPIGEKLCNLERIQVNVNGRQATALVDSGTEITVVRKNIVEDFPLENKPSIYIKGIFGPAEKCPLVNIPMSLFMGGKGDVVHQDVLCAVAPSLVEDVLLPPEIKSMLMGTFRLESVNPIVDNSDDEYKELKVNFETQETAVFDQSSAKEACAMEVKETSQNELSKTEEFLREQETCEDLKGARQNAQEGKGGFYLKDKFLFHREKILGETVHQLVLPKSRRKEVLKLAHCSVFGGHMGARKTAMRIRYSFYWNGLLKDVKIYCQSCKDCQLTRNIKIKDRAPITPVARPELPFQVVNIDAIGPIDPPSSKGHKYVLCLVDQHTRWAEAVPLTNLTAKATCEALLSIFMRTGIPNVIASDNGTNFSSALTREFERRIGSSPRLSTPAYPQSNGLVERFNRTLKCMLHHVIRDEPRSWHTKIPYILWAYREIPNSTTGVAPFQLLYGRKPEGPLSILENTWSGKLEALQTDTTPVSSYLEKLKAQLEDAAQRAKVTSQIEQEKMAHYYNLRSTSKVFKTGDKVIVLIPDSSNKLLARWQGPGTIVKKKNEHSFLVKMPDDSVKHVHQNKIREFIVESNSVNVIFEGEEEFGDVQTTPISNAGSSFHDKLCHLNLLDLTDIQRNQLTELLTGHKRLFTRPLQPVSVGEHKIELLPNVTRHKPHTYSIPMSYRTEVSRQVQELLESNLIEPSEAEITYPIVCVAKKDASIRICVDYRALNAVTRVPSYPMKDMQEMIFTAGTAQYLTCLDLRKGYYQIKMNENCKTLTAFSTHDGTYQWRVMPFGLSGASGTFQKALNRVLRNHSSYAQAYIDDIVIYSKTWDEHLTHLRNVLSELENFKFSVKLEKCTFAAKEIKFLGHDIGGGKHAPDSDKILAIKKLKRPTTKKDVRSILGLMSFYRSYIPNFAEIASPLTELTKGRKSNYVNWGKKEEESFQRLKNLLCEVTALSTPDCSKPFQIHSDASNYAIGCCLTQIDDKGDYKPIAFASQKFNSTQKNWSTIEKEAYAVLFGLKKFDKWLHGTVVEIITDHNPLKFLIETTPKSPKLTRWALALQRWNYKIIHRPGTFHLGADALSRLEKEQ